MKSYQTTIDQCEIAIKSLSGVLTENEFSECIDSVLKHNEWLLGLEFAIDWLVEDKRKIDKQAFIEFEKAYKLMNMQHDDRLKDLKSQIG